MGGQSRTVFGWQLFLPLWAVKQGRLVIKRPSVNSSPPLRHAPRVIISGGHYHDYRDNTDYQVSAAGHDASLACAVCIQMPNALRIAQIILARPTARVASFDAGYDAFWHRACGATLPTWKSVGPCWRPASTNSQCSPLPLVRIFWRRSIGP